MIGARTASRLTVLMVLVAIVWYAALVTLALRTSNPPTLNARQLLSSDLVVIGTVESNGTVRAKESFGLALPKEPIKLVQDGIFPTGEVILPLTRRGDIYRITATGLSGNADRLTYPLTESTRQQLESLFKR